MTMSVSGAGGVSAWQLQQGGIASAGGTQGPPAAPAQAAQASAEQQIATASAAMATGSTFSIMA